MEDKLEKNALLQYDKTVNLNNRIKSSFIFKKIFNFIDDNKKLNIIRYNKHSQIKLGIDIDYFKKKCKRYIVGERNGKGKEYTKETNTLIFEGDYLNGKRYEKQRTFKKS